MRKKLVNVICICLLCVTSIFTFQYFTKRAPKHKSKIPICAEQVSMDLPTDMTFEAIQGQERAHMIESISNFPMSGYQLFSVPRNGYFYLDNFQDMIKGALKQGRTWEPHIQNILQALARPGSTVLDIGAHIGTHTIKLAKAVGADGRVIAFEPQPKIFRELFMNMKINKLKNITFYWAGVGASEGQIELSPLSSSNEGGTGLSGGTGRFVQLLTIDSLHLQDVSLMKIDVEGMEDQALDGAKETILSNRPVIVIEIQGGSNFANTTQDTRRRIMHTLDKLDSMEYRVTQLDVHDWLAVPNEKFAAALIP